jgi:transcriptional regulator with XRE-family HTH domain
MNKSERLKTLRMLAGYTQDDLAAKLGAPRSALSIWENPSKYGPSEESVPSLADLLRVTPGYLVYGDKQFRTTVWTPQLPARSHHQISFISDLEALLPDFLEENGFKAVIAAELKDGYAFLLGRDATGSKHKYAYNCLILAEHRIAESLKTALEVAGMKGYQGFGDIVSMVDRCIETITANDIYERLLLKGRHCECDIDGLGEELEAARKRISAKESGKHVVLPPGLEYIFRSFLEALIPSIKSPVALGLTKFFLEKCEERGKEPKRKIADTLIPEFEQEFKRIGSLPLNTWPDPNNEEFLYLRDWLRDKLSDNFTSKDQRTALVDMITKGTDFSAWKENYEKEIREGKRLGNWF